MNPIFISHTVGRPCANSWWRNKEEHLAIAHELDAEAVNPSPSALDRDLVETAHEEDREVTVYTVDN